MTDIFDTKIHCKKDGNEMKQCIVNRNGLELRAVKCPKCGDVIIHPADLNAQEHFKDLRDKKFNVKLRTVGNSHAISIPKQIVDFMNERQREMQRMNGLHRMHKEMDNMVKLWFDDFDTLKVGFFDDGEDDIAAVAQMKNEDVEEETGNGRIKRKVRNDGKGNVDIVEQENISDPERGIHGFKIKKIRRRISGGRQ